MRETPRARQAFTDYLDLGPGRSLEKLHTLYQARGQTVGKAGVPTLRLNTLQTWSSAFGWQARLEEIAEAEQAAVIRRGISERQNRVDLYDDVVSRIRRLLDARAKDVADEVAGGDTGLLVRQVKLVKVYEKPTSPVTDDPDELVSAKRDVLVYEYVYDSAPVKDLREYAKQAAQDLGQWTEKQEVEHGGHITHEEQIDLSKLSRDELLALENILVKSADARPGESGDREA